MPQGEKHLHGELVAYGVLVLLTLDNQQETRDRVFEFNKRAIKFYEKIGYKKITSLKNFTCYAGKWWDDYRYEKNL